MFKKINNSLRLAQESWGVLKQDSELMIFPVLSVVATIAIALSFCTTIYFLIVGTSIDININSASNSGLSDIISLVFLFAMYFIGYCCVLFCNTALLYCAKMRFDGGNPTIKDGLQAGFANLRNIVAWAAIGATIGIILSQIEEKLGFLGSIIRMVVGGAWTVITYFAIPVIIFEGVGPIEGIKRSKAIIEKTWGESLTAVVGLQGAQTLISSGSILIFIASIVGAGALESWQLAAAGFGLMLLIMIGSSVVFSCLAQIYCAALYVYATTNEPPSAYSQESFSSAFK